MMKLDQLTQKCTVKKFKRHEAISRPGIIPDELFFINNGLIRVIVTGLDGKEHSLHFGFENDFIADYSAFILKKPALYTLYTEEKTEVVILPRAAIEWGYAYMQQGEKLGRLIAEHYFIYQDDRLKNLYARTPKERYDSITEVFPSIHNRLSQHLIASYLGITPVHLSRLKKAGHQKV